MIGNFQGSGNYSKIQYGAAWWFNDNYDEIRSSLQRSQICGCLGKFIGMVTDSRSFLYISAPRVFQTYSLRIYRRPRQEGKYPRDMEFLKNIAEDISYNNAAAYFGI